MRCGAGLQAPSAASLSSLGTAGGGTSLPAGFVIESTARLLKILSVLGAADVDWGTAPWDAGQVAAMSLFTDGPVPTPGYRVQLASLSRYGIRNFLVSQGHAAHICGGWPPQICAALLDALASYDE